MGMKKQQRKKFLEELTKVPIVSVACQASGISRNTIYRWRKEDFEFAADMDDSLNAGIEFINDISEHQLISLVRGGHFPAIRYWLQSRHRSFRYFNRDDDKPKSEATRLKARADVERMMKMWTEEEEQEKCECQKSEPKQKAEVKKKKVVARVKKRKTS